jgi:hypothetical protein
MTGRFAEAEPVCRLGGDRWLLEEDSGKEAPDGHPLSRRALFFEAQFELRLFLKGLGLDYGNQAEFWKDLNFFGPMNLAAV